MRSTRPGQRRQRGYTLVEAGFALVIATLLATAGLTAIAKRTEDMKVQRAQTEMLQLLEAGMAYYRDFSTWPASTAPLIAGNYIPASAINGPWGGTYSLSVVGGQLQVSYNATQAKYANVISATLPFANVVGTTVTGQIVVPGTELAHNALLPRDGSRPMTGALNMGGQNINNANAINASTVSAGTYYDANNPAYYLQPSGTSVTANMWARGEMRAPCFGDINNWSYYVCPSQWSVLNAMYAAIIYDTNDGNYYLDPNGTSNLNVVYAYQMYDRYAGWNDSAVHNVTLISSGQYIGKPSCYPGHSPHIYLAPSSYSNNSSASNIGAVQTWAVDVGWGWQANMQIYTNSGTVAPSSPYGQILAMTNCS